MAFLIRRKYSRTRGKEFQLCGLQVGFLEILPHARERETRRISAPFAKGNTPARAGKSGPLVCSLIAHWKYSRTRGKECLSHPQ